MKELDISGYTYPAQDKDFHFDVRTMKAAILMVAPEEGFVGERLTWLAVGYGQENLKLAYLHALMSDPELTAIPIPAWQSYEPNDAEADFFITTKKDAEKNYARFVEWVKSTMKEEG